MADTSKPRASAAAESATATESARAVVVSCCASSGVPASESAATADHARARRGVSARGMRSASELEREDLIVVQFTHAAIRVVDCHAALAEAELEAGAGG